MAYASETAIANEALFLCGADAIVSGGTIDTTTDQNAVIINRVFDAVRDDLLAKHDWHFADIVVALVVDAVVDNYTVYDYAYDLPSDIIRMMNLVAYATVNPSYNDAPYVPYLIRAGHLYTDETPCWIRYTAQITDVTAYPHWFGRAFAASLAAEIIPRLNADAQKQAGVQQLAMGRFMEAMRTDGLERKQYDLPNTPIDEVG